MLHPTEFDLIQWVGDRLPPQRRRDVARHLDRCAACRRLEAAQRRIWQATGTWQVDPAGRDLWPALQADLANRPLQDAPPRAGWPRVALRAAAAVLLAGLIGHLGGRWVRGPISTPPIQAPPDGEAVAQELRLDVLAREADVGLASALPVLLTDQPQEGIR